MCRKTVLVVGILAAASCSEQQAPEVPDSRGVADMAPDTLDGGHEDAASDGAMTDAEVADTGGVADLAPDTFSRWYEDADKDTFGNPKKSVALPVAPAGYVADNTDCDDTDALINPGASERCNGIDDDCNKLVDDGAPQKTYYRDRDGDGHGDSSTTIQRCALTLPAGYAEGGGDCDDNNKLISPAATELCNGIDDNCNKLVDDGAPKKTYFVDKDGDGYGNTWITMERCALKTPAGYADRGGDCDDDISSVNPAASEVCNGIDDNCNKQVDEGLPMWTFFADRDGDGHGDSTQVKKQCSPAAPSGYTNMGGDCDDKAPSWWLGDTSGRCTLEGFLACDRNSSVTKHCLPPVPNLVKSLQALGGRSIKKDKWAWNKAPHPGGASSGNKRHMQSIQYAEVVVPSGSSYTYQHWLVATMSDEHSTDNAQVVLVWAKYFGTESTQDDSVYAHRLLNSDAAVANFDHAGGAQLIGNYYFVALEDMKRKPAARTGVWHISRNQKYPTIGFKYAFPTGSKSYTHSAIGVTKLADQTYLTAACVEKGCQVIHFLKSRGTSLGTDPGFKLVHRWTRGAVGAGPNDWADCPPQNLNLAVDISGKIYLVLFGQEGVVPKCGSGAADDRIFIYRLDFTAAKEIKLVYISQASIKTNNACYPYLPVNGTNFDAGAGLMITPWRTNKVSVLATEHYDSCGSGKTRWGVTDKW